MNLSVLCDWSPPNNASTQHVRWVGGHHAEGYAPQDMARWAGTLYIDRLRWIQPIAAASTSQPFTSLGLFGHDAILDRLIQVR